MKQLYTGNKETAVDITAAHNMLLNGGSTLIVDISGIKKWLVKVEFEGLENTTAHNLTFQPFLYRIMEEVPFPSISRTLPITGDGLGICFFELEVSNSAFEALNNDLRMSIVSDNAGDNSVDIQCWIYEQDIVDSDNYVAADVIKWAGATVTLSTGNNPDVNIDEVSDDTTAPGNMELMYDGTGYAGGATKLDVNIETVKSGIPMSLADIKSLIKRLLGRAH